jgi:hypothetical protein
MASESIEKVDSRSIFQSTLTPLKGQGAEEELRAPRGMEYVTPSSADLCFLLDTSTSCSPSLCRRFW